MQSYEVHENTFSKTRPFIFHYDDLDESFPSIHLNWHEDVEVLFFKKGSAKVHLNSEIYSATEGDIVVINSNTLHKIEIAGKCAEYYCLISSSAFLEQCGLNVINAVFTTFANSDIVRKLYDNIIHEHKKEDPFKNMSIMGSIISLFVALFRNHLVSANKNSGEVVDSKTLIVREALKYIRLNFTQKISLHDIAKYIGFSKDYLGHAFKDVTGHSVVYYVNLLRCQYARTILSSDHFSVSEAAVLCGFDNVSYFTHTYKKFIGELPSSKEKST